MEYPICAKPASIVRSQFRDIDEQAAQLSDHGQRYRQLSRGPFDGTFLTAALGPDEWLYLEDANQALLQQGGGPTGAASFMILLRSTDHCRFQDADFTSGDLAIIPAGSEFSCSSPANTGFCVITLNARTVEQMVASAATGGHARRVSSPAIGYAVQALRMLVRSSIAMAEQTDRPESANALSHVRNSLVSALGLALSNANGSHALPPPTLFRRALAVIEEHLNDINVLTLCHALDVPRRTIEDAFHREVGMGPARMIKLLRLGQIRRDITIERPQVPLADIASRWGLWHPSHFTHDYHATFGELPSKTRRMDGAGCE